MEHTEIINTLFKQINENINVILQTSYMHCKTQDPSLASSFSKINNTSFELKRVVDSLKGLIDSNGK